MSNRRLFFRIWLERAWRICRQRPKDTNELYALHTRKRNVSRTARTGSPMDSASRSLSLSRRSEARWSAHVLLRTTLTTATPWAEQLTQTNLLLRDLPEAPNPTTVLAVLRFRGVDASMPPIQLTHRGEHKTSSGTQRKWLKRCPASEPITGQVEQDGACGVAGSKVKPTKRYEQRCARRAIDDYAFTWHVSCSRSAERRTNQCTFAIARTSQAIEQQTRHPNSEVAFFGPSEHTPGQPHSDPHTAQFARR